MDREGLSGLKTIRYLVSLIIKISMENRHIQETRWNDVFGASNFSGNALHNLGHVEFHELHHVELRAIIA